MLAVAGAGKTYYICHSIDKLKRNLILAYTNENIHNIIKELCNACGQVPDLTTVTTFDSFVYHDAICPYEPSIAQHFSCTAFKSNGICTLDPPPQRIKNEQGKQISNPKYVKKDKIRHYVTKGQQYYCQNMTELIMQLSSKKEDSLILRVANRINQFYDQVLIDEFQDFREFDYEVIMGLAKYINNIVLVGDYYQHSVSAINNSGKPFKNRAGFVSYPDFIKELEKKKFVIDTTTLAQSRRCSSAVCEFISKKLGIAIASKENKIGNVIWSDENAVSIIENKEIMKLVYNNSNAYSFRSMNWSYSKGDTFDNVCVILTGKFDELDREDFSVDSLSPIEINKLYVAMTRSSGNLYLIKASTFKNIKKNYIMSN
jgi:DNA helicase-2/ATP-dependent DNA helicase PcrA